MMKTRLVAGFLSTCLAVPLFLGAEIAQAAEPHPASCRVRVPLGGSASLGSGTLIAADGSRGLVLTAYHVIDGTNGQPITCTFADGRQYAATVTAYDAEADLAALTIAEPHVAPVEVSLVAADPSHSPYWTSGYGGNGRFQTLPGRRVGQSHSSGRVSMIVNSVVRPGDSGAALFNRRGRMVGVIWGCRPQDRETYVTSAGPFRRFIGRLFHLGIPVRVIRTSLAEPPLDPSPQQPTPAVVTPMQYIVYEQQCYGGSCFGGQCSPGYYIPQGPTYYAPPSWPAPQRPSQPAAKPPWEGQPWGQPITDGDPPAVAPAPPSNSDACPPNCTPCDCGPKWEAVENRLTAAERKSQEIWESAGPRIDKLETQVASIESRMVPIQKVDSLTNIVTNIDARVTAIESQPTPDVAALEAKLAKLQKLVDRDTKIRVYLPDGKLAGESTTNIARGGSIDFTFNPRALLDSQTGGN